MKALEIFFAIAGVWEKTEETHIIVILVTQLLVVVCYLLADNNP